MARVLALAIVVAGHLTLAVIDRDDGELRGANLLELRPHWAWLAAMAPMPVFFVAAGWANATTTVTAAAQRLRTLVGVGAVLVAGWSIGVVVAELALGDAGIAGDGARVATQPLWFLAAYVPMAAAGGSLARLGSRHLVLAVGGCLVALAGLDLVRFALDAPDWIGWPGFFLAWGTPWLVGGWWRARCEEDAFPERRVGAAIVVIAVAAAAALVAFAGYNAPLIDAVEGARSNTTPPTLYTAVIALAQAGVLMVAARGLDRVGRRWRRLWDRAGEAAVGVYVWHLTALSLCVGIIAAGMPTPRRLTGLWWVTRPVWWVVVLAVTMCFVAATAAVRARLRDVDGQRDTDTAGAVLGVAIAAAGAATVGLEGPRTLPLAITCAGLFVVGWLLLGGRRIPGGKLAERAPAP